MESVEIASSSLKAAKHFGKIKANLKKEGAIISDFDILIGSYALANDLTLVTNNEGHFNRVRNLKVENWL